MRAVVCVRLRYVFVNASKGVLCRPSSYRGRRELEVRPRQNSPHFVLQTHSITSHVRSAWEITCLRMLSFWNIIAKTRAAISRLLP